MPSSSEGRYETEAARQRLAAAKAQASLASQNVETTTSMEVSMKSMLEAALKNLNEATANMNAANKNKAAACSQLQIIEKEVKMATEAREEAESRWEVIDIADSDVDSPMKEAHGSKRRKVSEVLVQDAGTSCVNGLYKQISQINDGAPMYIKKGQYKGNQSATFLIWRSANKIWYICLSGVREPVTFYYADVSTTHGIFDAKPPSTGWTVNNDWKAPSPICCSGILHGLHTHKT